jgi:alkylated DNA repair dioxygenase AlkB
MLLLENKSINDEILFINPTKESAFTKIFLSKNKKSWITIEWISEDLLSYATNSYQSLFKIHPEQRGKIVMNNQQIDSPRWHQCYLHQPKIGATYKKSYMYSGLEPFGNLTLPVPFQKFLDFLNEKEKTNKYNQIIINWYENGRDYTAPHSDCQQGIIANEGIAIVTFCEDVNFPRALIITPKKLENEINDYLFKKLKIKLEHGCIVTMHGDIQKNFRHSVPKQIDNKTSRISLTFRKFL